jgi:hypothetical protein
MLKYREKTLLETNITSICTKVTVSNELNPLNP